jgi:hypothetical protein
MEHVSGMYVLVIESNRGTVCESSILQTLARSTTILDTPHSTNLVKYLFLRLRCTRRTLSKRPRPSPSALVVALSRRLEFDATEARLRFAAGDVGAFSIAASERLGAGDMYVAISVARPSPVVKLGAKLHNRITRVGAKNQR